MSLHPRFFQSQWRWTLAQPFQHGKSRIGPAWGTNVEVDHLCRLNISSEAGTVLIDLRRYNQA